MSMTRAARRDDRGTRRARRLAAADRRIGHDLAYWYMARPYVIAGAALVVVAVAVGWVWTSVDHSTIALVLGSVGVVLFGAYAWWLRATSSAHARIMSRATGTPIRGALWHPVGAAGVCLIAAAVLIQRNLS
jgi:hypothetical protein